MSQGGNAAILENGKIKFKREGVYLFITTMGITISSDNNGYYDLDLFYNNYQNGGIIVNNARPNRGYIGRYNFTNVMYCKKMMWLTRESILIMQMCVTQLTLR